MLRVWLVGPGGVVGSFDFDRGTRDFSERDRLVLQTLAPHLVRIRQLAARAPDRAEGSVPQMLTQREREVLSLVAGRLTNRANRGQTLSRTRHGTQAPRQRLREARRARPRRSSGSHGREASSG